MQPPVQYTPRYLCLRTGLGAVVDRGRAVVGHGTVKQSIGCMAVARMLIFTRLDGMYECEPSSVSQLFNCEDTKEEPGSEQYAHAIFRGHSEAESGADRVAELLEGGQLLG